MISSAQVGGGPGQSDWSCPTGTEAPPFQARGRGFNASLSRARLSSSSLQSSKDVEKAKEALKRVAKVRQELEEAVSALQES